MQKNTTNYQKHFLKPHRLTILSKTSPRIPHLARFLVVPPGPGFLLQCQLVFPGSGENDGFGYFTLPVGSPALALM